MTCNNKIKEGRKPKLCGISRSFPSNTWFSHSQVALTESLVFVGLRLSMVEWQSVHPNPKRIILGLAQFSRLGIVLPGCGVDEF